MDMARLHMAQHLLLAGRQQTKKHSTPCIMGQRHQHQAYEVSHCLHVHAYMVPAA